ncbi:amino acid permease [Candidatus Saccharibacteria bacterium]|nr:amino acid permease [Candidatus Saccharibacteria bacterium]
MGTIIRLQRKFNLPLLTFYGVGNILGAGIYVLIGKVAASAGPATLLAFLVASIVAALSAFSYMELSARFPMSAGAAVYVHHAYKKRLASMFVGFCMVASALVSSAALARGFAGYFSEIVTVNQTLIAVIVVLAMGFVAAWGIDKTAVLATIFTIVELVGLLAVVWFGRDLLVGGANEATLLALPDVGVAGVLTGAFLAFYAYIGFEDMVNVSEEVKNPRKTMPRAILLSLIISTVIYLLVVVVSTRAVGIEALAASDSPLALVFRNVSTINPLVMVAVGLAATINGILVQITMASRMLYGMANKGWVNKELARIHVKTKTPIVATAIVVIAMVIAVITLDIVMLAKITSLLVLVVFILVNSALVVVKHSHPRQRPTTEVPLAVPIAGVVTCLVLVCYQAYTFLS